jgi:hypothetical protein
MLSYATSHTQLCQIIEFAKVIHKSKISVIYTLRLNLANYHLAGFLYLHLIVE